MPQASTRQGQRQQQLDISQSGGAGSLLTTAVHEKMAELSGTRATEESEDGWICLADLLSFTKVFHTPLEWEGPPQV